MDWIFNNFGKILVVLAILAIAGYLTFWGAVAAVAIHFLHKVW